MGEVWHGRHAQLGHDVAIKLMKQDAAQDQNLVGRFRREARIAAQLRSKYIVRVEDYGTTSDGRPYLVMEFLRGQTLAALLQKTPRPDRAFVARVVQHIASACDVAHPAGIVHRDLKPENCFVVQDDDGSPLVKVLDFGVAKVTDNVFVTQSGVVTGSHALLGTPVYMSPEQARGEPNIDGRSDLWSLAVITYEMLTGRIPFDVGSLAQVLYAVLAGAIPPPSTMDPMLPRAVDAWAHRALNRDRAQRFSTGRELSAALAQSLGLARVTPAELQWSASPSSIGTDRTVAVTASESHYPPSMSAPPAGPMSYAPLHMPTAAPAPNEALTWSGAGGGAPLVHAPMPLPAAAIPVAHPSMYPPGYPAHPGVTAHPAYATQPHAGTHAAQVVALAPAVNRRRLHGMGFVFLAVGVLSAAALGSVVRSRRAHPQEPSGAQSAAQPVVRIDPPVALTGAPSASTQRPNATNEIDPPRVAAQTRPTNAAHVTNANVPSTAISAQGNGTSPTQTAVARATGSGAQAAHTHSTGAANASGNATTTPATTTSAGGAQRAPAQGERSFDQL